MEIKVKIEYERTERVTEDKTLDFNCLEDYLKDVSENNEINDEEGLEELISEYITDEFYYNFEDGDDCSILESNVDELVKHFSYLITPKEEKSGAVCPCCNQTID